MGILCVRPNDMLAQSHSPQAATAVKIVHPHRQPPTLNGFTPSPTPLATADIFHVCNFVIFQMSHTWDHVVYDL